MILEEFDPLHPAFDTTPQNHTIVEWCDIGNMGQTDSRRTIKWRFARAIQSSLVPRIMNKIHHSVRITHKLKHLCAYTLRNTENGDNKCWF